VVHSAVKIVRHQSSLFSSNTICDWICQNPTNRLLFQNEIEARKVDAVINVVVWRIQLLVDLRLDPPKSTLSFNGVSL